MHVLIAGNLVNLGFYLSRKLRELNIDVDLLMEKDPSLISDPMSTGILEDEYPEWIKFFDKKKKRWKFDVINHMRKYDLVLAMTEFPIFAMLSLKPFIAITTGADTRELIHEKSLKGFLLKLSYNFAKVVVYVMPTQLLIIKKNKIKNAIFIPILKKRMNDPLIDNKKDEFVIFHPTNHIWKDKHNDLFLNAFIEIAKKRDDIFLITLNRGIDAKKSIDLLKSASIEGRYEIIDSTLNQDEISKFYKKCDAIADQFVLGSLGLIGIDCLSIGKPLISFIDEVMYKEAYGEIPPTISSQNPKTLADLITKIFDDKKIYDKIGRESKEWYEKFHSEDILIKKYIILIEMVMSGKKYHEIIKKIVF